MPASGTNTSLSDLLTFEQLWKEAVQRTLNSEHVDPKLANCKTIDDVINELERKESAHRMFREKGRNVRDVLVRVAGFVGRFLDAGAEAAAASGHVPGGKAILVAFGALLSATKGVSEIYDALEELFAKLNSFFRRLDAYLASPFVVSPELKVIMIKILVQFLDVLTICTRHIHGDMDRFGRVKMILKRTKDYFKVLFGNTEVKAALDKLDKLTGEELQRSMAEVLVASKAAARDVAEIRKELFTTGITKWLSPPDHEESHNRVCKSRWDAEDNWLLSSSQFSHWVEGKNGVLCIHGKPGSGKSAQFSYVVDELSAKTVTIYFYFDYRDPAKQTVRGFLTSALYQLASRSSDCSGILNKLYEESRASLSPPNDDKLFGCLKNMLRASPQVNLLLDVLDECSKDERRTGLLRILKEIIALNLDGFRLLVTSRPETDIRNCMASIATSQLILHGAPEHLQGLECHIRSRLASTEDYPGWSEDLRRHAGDVLNDKSDGMFLWANLQLERLRECPLSDVKRRLHSLPTTLHDTYRRILEDIKADDALLAHRVFECIAFATRPLSPKELAEVLALDFESGDALIEPAFRPADPESSLLRICSGLIQIITSTSNGEETEIVQFVHFSAKEYLLSAQLPKRIATYGMSAVSAHTILARLCFSVINSSTDLSSQPFASYATRNWMEHVRLDSVQVIMNKHLLKLLHPDSVFFSRWLEGLIALPDYSLDIDCPFDKHSTPLFIAAHSGLYEQVRVLMDELGVETNHPKAPVVWAAVMANNTEVARLLLERGADVDRPHLGIKPLALAAILAKSPKIVRLLLQYGANIDACNDHGYTALCSATMIGEFDIARLLLELGAIVDARSIHEYTLLHAAAGTGHAEFVRLLLERGADVSACTGTQVTPLHLSAQTEHADVVHLLLERGAQVDARDAEAWTPLYWAVSNGRLDVARTLLEHGADINARAKDQATPLYLSAWNDRLEVVRLLLDQGADVHAWTADEETALHVAAERGHLDTLRVLVEHGANVNAHADYAYTPLHLAIKTRHVKVVRLLLDQGADVSTSRFGNSPLHFAANVGLVDVVHLLLEKGAAVDAQNIHKWTPVHFAARSGHVDVVRLLLEQGAAVNARQYGWTPLHWASCEGHVEVVRLLLELGADVDDRNKDAWTSLHLAAQNGHADVARLLLEQGADVDACIKHQGRLRSGAVQQGSPDIVHLPLERGVDVDAREHDEWTSLHWAAREGHVDTARLLLERGAAVRAFTKDGMTPMSLAASFSHDELVSLLLEWLNNAPGSQ